MNDTLTHVVVVPYADFLERRERRRRIAAELALEDRQRTIDAALVSAAGANPLTSDQKYRYEGPRRVKDPEPTT